MTKRDWQCAYDNNITILNSNELYDTMLDDCYEPVMIAGYEYQVSRTLKEVDQIAYNCGRADYIDSLLTDGVITELDDGTLVDTNELKAFDKE